MTARVFGIALGAVALLAGASAHAGLPMTMADFTAACRADGEALSHCLGYLQGVADMQEAYTTMQVDKPFFCVPRATSAEVLRGAVLEWSDANAASMEAPASVAVLAAFQAKYPCP